MAMEACPSISETILGLTFLDRSSVAQVCRRSWKRMGSNPAFSRSGAKDRFLRLVGLTSVPPCVAKMRLRNWLAMNRLTAQPIGFERQL